MSAAHARKEPRTKAKRVVFRVTPTKYSAFPWKLNGNGRTSTHERKSVAVNLGRIECDALWRYSGIRAQLVIHNKDGRIQSERTYGADPVRRKG